MSSNRRGLNRSNSMNPKQQELSPSVSNTNFKKVAKIRGSDHSVRLQLKTPRPYFLLISTPRYLSRRQKRSGNDLLRSRNKYLRQHTIIFTFTVNDELLLFASSRQNVPFLLTYVDLNTYGHLVRPPLGAPLR